MHDSEGDFPVSYLFYVIGTVIAIGAVLAGFGYFWLR